MKVRHMKDKIASFLKIKYYSDVILRMKTFENVFVRFLFHTFTVTHFGSERKSFIIPRASNSCKEIRYMEFCCTRQSFT